MRASTIEVQVTLDMREFEKTMRSISDILRQTRNDVERLTTMLRREPWPIRLGHRLCGFSS